MNQSKNKIITGLLKIAVVAVTLFIILAIATSTGKPAEVIILPPGAAEDQAHDIAALEDNARDYFEETGSWPLSDRIPDSEIERSDCFSGNRLNEAGNLEGAEFYKMDAQKIAYRKDFKRIRQDLGMYVIRIPDGKVFCLTEGF